jgi:hypothetical protein
MTDETAERKGQRILKENGYHLVERCCGACDYFETGYEDEAFCKLTQIDDGLGIYMADVSYAGLCNKWKPWSGEEEG